MKTITKKNRFEGIFFISAFFIVCIILATLISSQLQPINKNEYLEITISEGDNLWNLAQTYSKEHSLTTSSFINWVEKVNKIDADRIKPGESIVLPIPINNKELALNN